MAGGQWAQMEAIRKMYGATAQLEYTPYLMDWITMFSPIEYDMWGSIRGSGLPFWPQYPIGRFFADFAEPVKKIVIECDGKAFHLDKEKDAKRDDFMSKLGWSVFRLPGYACKKALPSACELQEQYGEDWNIDCRSVSAIRDWYLNTSDGLVAAIGEAYYGSRLGLQNSVGVLSGDLVKEALSKWRTA